MIAAILLCGGTGKRIGASKPKQYLPLLGKPIALRSLDALLTFPNFTEIAIVCDPQYQSLFLGYSNHKIIFARPGKTREESVKNAFFQLGKHSTFVCIHDGARPFLQQKELLAVIEEGMRVGAAALATAVTSTIKQADSNLQVLSTLQRSSLWSIQTPQVVKVSLLASSYHMVMEECTDDVSRIEKMGHPVQLVEGRDDNIKITTPIDLQLASILARNLYNA